MIWKRLRKSKQSEEREFRDMIAEHVPWRDRLLMILSAFLVLVIPAALVLTGMGFLILWIFGAL